ncbi:hypothetical protein ACFLZT_02165 [Thermodesulfobacteriota bacterium]
MDFDDFEWEDAAVFGGIAGFSEESLKEESSRDPSEIEKDYEFNIDSPWEKVQGLKWQIQMLAAVEPNLERYIIRKARELREQQALYKQARRLLHAAIKAAKHQEEEKEKGILNEESMSDALTKWAEYQWALLDEKEHEKYPDLYWLEEIIGEDWQVNLDYCNLYGKWEEGLKVLPKRFAKLNGKVFLHAFCTEWKKEWYFHLDRIRNMKFTAESEEKSIGDQ